MRFEDADAEAKPLSSNFRRRMARSPPSRMHSMFDNLKNMAGLMNQAREFRQKLEETQAELARRTVEGDAGAGAVRVVINGKLEVLSVHLDRPMITALAGEGTQADQKMIEDLIAAAFNAAMAKAQEMAKDEMSRLTGGMNLPGLDQLMGR